MWWFILFVVVAITCLVMKNALIALYHEAKLRVMRWWNNDNPGNWF